MEDFQSRPSGEPYFIYLGHVKPRELIDFGVLTRGALEGTVTFAVCRNPFERSLSLYEHFRRKGMVAEGFRDFLQLVWNPSLHEVPEFGARIKQMCRPMHYWLGANGWEGPRVVFRFEEFDSIPKTLSRVSQVDLELEQVGTRRKRADFQFTDEEVAMIQEIYEVDFLSYGYSIVPQ